jgi:riboflavin synthase
MFTGIVAAVGTVRKAPVTRGGRRLGIDAGNLGLGDVATGDSVAVNGVCLTVVARKARSFEVDVSRETLACISGLTVGDRVNLEKAMRLSGRLGGHLVTGHIDGVGAVKQVVAAGDNRVMAVKAPAGLAKYIARKGSITVNGVSLTVNAVKGADFKVNLIPHTLSATNLGRLRAGDKVNLEVDILARYAERLKSKGKRR